MIGAFAATSPRTFVRVALCVWIASSATGAWAYLYIAGVWNAAHGGGCY